MSMFLNVALTVDIFIENYFYTSECVKLEFHSGGGLYTYDHPLVRIYLFYNSSTRVLF